MFVNALIREL